jgi:orotate phosphoribosyltransferase
MLDRHNHEDEIYLPEITPRYSYTHDAIYFGEAQIADAKSLLADVDYDMIIGTGLSGGLVIPKLADALGVDWGIVRKEEEESHRERRVEGTRFGRKWVFVDDFVASGATRRRVKAEVQRYCRDRGITTEYAGTYSYRNSRFTKPEREGEDEW